MRLTLAGLFFQAFVFFCPSVSAQNAAPTNADRCQIHLVRTAEKMNIDGEPNEIAWQNAPLATDFWQQQPVDGKPATRRTEVRLLYDERYLYVAATCYDTAVYFIETLKRDNYDGSDEFAVILDPQGQKTNGVGFGVNALGAQTEVLITPDGADESWDNRWASAVRRHPDRWTVEMAIPFKTLRFKDGNPRWGINFLRSEPDFNEKNVWAPVPRQFEQHDLGYFGSLIWDTPPRKSGNNVSLIPYATGALRQSFSPNAGTNLKPAVGGDAKIALTSSLNLDLTTFPDFSQVEVDRQVTNLTRFGIFFPERRQFFIENGDIFAGFGTDFGAEQPFYSRSIGLDASGRTVPILYGARLTGNLNPRLRVGAFNIHTRSAAGRPGQNYSAATFQQRLWARSTLKGLFLNRQGFEESDRIRGDYGRNLGGEFEFNTANGKWLAKAGGLHSMKPGFSVKNNHLYSRLAYAGTRFRTFLEVQNMGENYFSDLGFTGRLVNYDPEQNEEIRVGFTQISNMTDYYTYPKSSRRVNFHWSGLENFVYVNPDGTLNEWYTRLRHFVFFKNTAQLRFRLNNNYVDLLYPFAITETPLPATAYNMMEFNVQFNTDTRKRVILTAFTVYGQFFGGSKLTNRYELTLRAQPWGNFSAGLERNDIWLPRPYGNTTLTLATARAEVNFSTNLFWTTFLQYNTQADNFNVNSRLQWRFAPMSDLYFVYTDNYRVAGVFGPKDRALVLKLNYWLSL
jgi:Domain of unknown function (DUF5916)/Carbohydrate family 9 binding domain-like